MKIGISSISLMDMNDAIISDSQPANPSTGTLWLDTSGSNNVLKKWNGSSWENVGELDPNLSNDLSSLQSNIDNIQIGGRNYALGTATPATATGTGGSNQCTNIYSVDFSKLAGKEVTLSFDLISNVSSGTAIVQWNNTPWGTLSNSIPVSTTKNHYSITRTQPTSGSATGLSIRLDSVNGTVTVSNLKLEIGNKETDYSEAPEDIQAQIDKTSKQISDMANDNKLTPIEKQDLQKDWQVIQGEKPTIDSQASSLGVSTANYDNAYNTLNSYITPLLSNLSTTSDISGITLRSNFTNYFNAKVLLQKAISDAYTNSVANSIHVGGRNLIRNSSFDDGMNFWSANGDTTILQNKFQGYNAIHITASSGYIDLTQTIDNISPSTEYTFSANLGGAVKIYFVEMKSDGSNTSTYTNNYHYYPAQNYEDLTPRIFFTFKTQPDTAKLEMYFRVEKKSTESSTSGRGTLFKLEEGNKPTSWTPEPKDESDQISLIENRVSDVEQNTTEDSIINTVLSSDSYKTDLDSKANSDDLSNYATNDDLTNAINDVNDRTDQKINDIDFSPYVKQTDLEQTVDGINAKFTSGGGVNLIRNSVGYARTDHWTVSGTINTVQNDELKQLGFESGFTNPIGVSGNLTQTIYTFIDQYYTISFYLNKYVDNSSNSDAGIQLFDSNNNFIQFVGKLSNQGTTDGYEKFSYTFQAKTATTIIKLVLGTNTSAIITGLMFNIGYNPLQWTMATGELYNTNILMDMNGITVLQNQNGVEAGRTVMTPEKFAGYFDVNGDGMIDESNNSEDEVFRMDKDEFVMKKASVKEEITMGTIKIVKLNNVLHDNLSLGTGTSATVTGSGGSNQCTTIYSVSDPSKIAGKTVTLSFDVVSTTNSGTVTVQWNNTPWGLGANAPASTTQKHYSFTSTQPTIISATNLQVRLDGVNGSVTISNLKLEFGSHETEWSPALSDTGSSPIQGWAFVGIDEEAK